jgi:multidrug efflux system membrane fusion protein
MFLSKVAAKAEPRLEAYRAATTPRQRKIGAAVALVAAGFVVWRVGSALFGNGGPPPSPPVPVVTEIVASRDVPLYLNGIGTVRAYNMVTVHSRVDGELVSVNFQEGQTVKKGDVLAQIDPRPFQAAYASARGAAGRNKAALANARRDLARYQELAANGYATRQQLDTAVSSVHGLEAATRSDAANIESAKVQLDYTTITAPIDGRTGIRQIDAGNIIHAADANGLVTIAQVQPISAIFTLPQSQLPQVTASGPAESLTVTAFSSDGTVELDRGNLELIDNQIDPSTGTVRLKARFPNAKQTLWPGEFINVRLQLGVVHNGIQVPAEVIQRGPKGSYAYVVKPDNTVEMRLVEIQSQQGGEVLVTKGLNSGDRVVLDGQLKLAPGARVSLVTPKPADASSTAPSAPAR